jgi:excisionase family DNA binding protein
MSADQRDLALLNEPLLNAEQAAALLNVRPSWVRDATRAGRLPCIRVGRHLRYTRQMLDQWAALQRHTTSVRTSAPGGRRLV